MFVPAPVYLPTALILNVSDLYKKVKADDVGAAGVERNSMKQLPSDRFVIYGFAV